MKWVIIIFCLSIFGCTDKYHIYSPDKTQCITIMDFSHIRYIISGDVKKIPNTGYIKLNISTIDRTVGDQILGAWDKNNLRWAMTLNRVAILENKLDTAKFKFYNTFPKDEERMPIDIYEDKAGYFSMSFDYGKLVRYDGVVVDRFYFW